MRIRGLPILAIAALASAGCLGSAPAERPGEATDRIVASGFPVGTYTKDFQDPFHEGPVRIAWTFTRDGRWAEVPEALDGRTLGAPPGRGTYTVDGETLTIATDYPPDWGTSLHAWRLDGTLLWTTFVSSDVEGDAEWFAMLDALPWTPIE